MGSIYDFFNDYQVPLITCLLKDRSSGVEIRLNGLNLLNDIEKTNYEIIEINSPETITNELLQNAINNGKLRELVDNKYILTEVELQEIYKQSIDNIKWNKENRNRGRKETFFGAISLLTSIKWTDGLLSKYKDSLCWKNLSYNCSIKWDLDRIDKFSNYISFKNLSFNTNVEFTPLLIEKYVNQWDWHGLSGNPTAYDLLGDYLLNHTRTVWRPFDERENLSRVLWREFFSVNDPYFTKFSKEHFLRTNTYDWPVSYSSNIPSSISNNTAIKWTVKLFETYGSKIDLWLSAFYSKFDNEVIFDNYNKLCTKRIVGTSFHRTSDWYDDHPKYAYGWENLFKNKQFTFDLNMLKYLNNNFAERVCFTGDAREGFTEKIEKIKLSEFGLDYKKLDLNFGNINQILMEPEYYLPQKEFSKSERPESKY